MLPAIIKFQPAKTYFPVEILKFHLELYNFQVEMSHFLVEILTTCLVFNPYFEH